ncbi:MAG: HAD family hydrolase [Pseudomonadota bacterium]
MLKGAIFSLHDVLVKQGANDSVLFDETLRLLRYLKARGVEPVFVSNHDWTFTADGKALPFRTLLEERLGPVSYYIGGQGGMPYKPRANASAFILAAKGWQKHEAIYVGNTTDDMKTAANGGLLFLNAMWHATASPYGFQFASPLDIARFIDCLCLGLDGWFWKLENGALRVYALAPFTTLSPKYAQAHAYSENAKATSKHGAGDANFWGRLLAARVYFSGLGGEIDYITAYPGHAPTSNQTVIADALNILGQSLRKSYLPDLIIRHSKAVKSQTARASGGSVGLDNQLNTIRLNPAPKRGVDGNPYKSPPARGGKTVLLIDDICTEGNSFEAGRAYLAAAGAKTICLSWLKTINTDYRAVSPAFGPFNPYMAHTFPTPIASQSHWYSSAISAHGAPTDLAEVYNRYFKWAWPTGH